ncbi:hypothetical protein [Planomicrobium sp. CPCC 101110]|uniref:hypothetical protein n=1 Tax=Planomicrobium sp. CPCC 101110 TaxID=2599619 RepID=UPI002102C5AF|nr:hypothetical protein [Planomicrobium sp. CPCC 101110]
MLETKQVIEAVETIYKPKSKKQAEAWPTIFCDFEFGKADMDMKSGYLNAFITGIRTGAAGALGVKYLAMKDSRNLLVLKAGEQAIFQVAAARNHH